MNRETRRRMKKGNLNGLTNGTLAKPILSAIVGGTLPQDISEGDRVVLDIQAMKRHPDYNRLSERYRKFVESHINDVFTVCYDKRYQDRPIVVCLEEDPNRFLFWTGNLKKLDD